MEKSDNAQWKGMSDLKTTSGTTLKTTLETAINGLTIVENQIDGYKNPKMGFEKFLDSSDCLIESFSNLKEGFKLEVHMLD